MRLSKTIAVEGGSVTVLELRVEDVRSVLADFKRFEAVDVRSLLLDRFDEAGALLKPVLQFNGNASLGGLSFSEVSALKNAFTEVNAAFLALLGLDDLFQPAAQTDQPPASTVVASPSSSADMVA